MSIIHKVLDFFVGPVNSRNPPKTIMDKVMVIGERAEKKHDESLKRIAKSFDTERLEQSVRTATTPAARRAALNELERRNR